MSHKELQIRYFDVYSTNLTAMHESWEGFPLLQDTFMCALCLGLFDRQAIDADLLSLEHCIPESLGGTLETSTLTCKGCNNAAGSALDAQLIKRFQADAFKAGLSDKVFRGHFELPQGKARATFWQQPRHQLAIQIHKDRTHPDQWKAVIDAINEQKRNPSDPKVTLHFEWEYRSLNAYIALLRAGFLMMFRQFGYGYALSTYLDPVREQLQKPHEQRLPLVYVLDMGKSPPISNTVAAVTNPPHLRVMLAVMRFSAGGLTAHKAVILPLMNENADALYARMARIGEHGKPFGAAQMTPAEYSLDRLRDPNSVMFPYLLTDYLNRQEK